MHVRCKFSLLILDCSQWLRSSCDMCDIVSINMPPHSCTKLLVFHLPSSVSHPVLFGPATFLSSYQLSRHSMHPPSSLPLLDVLLSHSLTFSLRLIPLTMHVPKTDLIFIHGTSPPNPPHPLHHHSPVLPPFQTQALTAVPVQVHRLTSPLLHLEPHPHPPNHVRSWWNLEACVSGMSTNSEPFAGIKPWACMCLFALSVSPALLNWRATLLVEGGGPKVNTAENNKEVKERR